MWVRRLLIGRESSIAACHTACYGEFPLARMGYQTHSIGCSVDLCHRGVECATPDQAIYEIVNQSYIAVN